MSVPDDVARLADVLARISALTEEANALRAEISAQLGAGKHAVGPVTVDVYAPRRFAPDLAAKVLTAEQFSSICTPQASSTLAKQLLSPDSYAACQRLGARTVRLT